MEGQMLLFVNVVFMFVGRSSAKLCDRATSAQVQAGNLGQSAVFNWLGVLHVHLHDEDVIRIAITGIVLVKARYALANADDVIRIPQQVFKSDSKAMFLVARDTPWFAKPKSYVIHPEYEFFTLNTIAIVELNLDNVDDFPLNPICIPTGETFNTSRYLYLTGFTDENQKMEKVIYNIQYLEKQACEIFYNRTGLSSQNRIPSAYVCGYAPGNVTQCVWDNGLALVSNVSGYFHLIGFGIHGPGCAAPARFIDLFPYFSWIKSMTSTDEEDAGHRRKEDAGNTRKADAGYRHKEDDEFIPIHELFTMKGSRRVSSTVYEREYEPYLFDSKPLEYFIIKPTEDNALLVIPFNGTWEQYEGACKFPRRLMYTEYFELKATGKSGTANYKLSLYDLVNPVCACVRISVDCEKHSEAVLTFKEEFNYKEGVPMLTPEHLLPTYTGIKRTAKPKQTTGKWKPNLEHMQPAFINDDTIYRKQVLNVDLFIQIQFTDRAVLNFELLAEPGSKVRELEISSTTPTSNSTPTSDPTPTSDSTTTSTIEATITPTTMKAKLMMKMKRATNRPKVTTKPKSTTQKRQKLKVQTTDKSHWGMYNWVNKYMLNEEAEASLMADVEGVQDTESAARSDGTQRAVVVACWLVSVCLRRAFFIH